jgi:phenylacetate-coenzyme A ligase PaaK-like adenylate-forming protein
LIIPDELFKQDPFGLLKEEKQELLLDYLNRLQRHHEKASPLYAKILSACGLKGVVYRRLEDFLFLPVRLFKTYDLKSVEDSEVVTVLVSSGTTSQQVSRIHLDRHTSTYQVKALASILKSFIGSKRMPMLIVDSDEVLKNPKLFSARGAGILGISRFGKNHTYLLDKNMNMKIDILEEFLEKFKEENLLIFGFTFMVWEHMYKELVKRKKTMDLSRAVLIHAGGWKKLHEEAVDNAAFKSRLKELCGIHRVYDFYGMVEQVGSIFMECSQGHFHAPVYADIIIRDPLTWKSLDYGEKGIIEVISILPYSYPGNVLLTEDTGAILGEDDCPCGRAGKYFHVFGRVPQAELRGCSDTYAFGRQGALLKNRPLDPHKTFIQ